MTTYLPVFLAVSEDGSVAYAVPILEAGDGGGDEAEAIPEGSFAELASLPPGVAAIVVARLGALDSPDPT